MGHNILKLVFFGVIFSIKSITFSNAQNNLVNLSVQENIVDISSVATILKTGVFEYRSSPSDEIKKGYLGHFVFNYQGATLKQDNNLCSVIIPKYLHNVSIVNPKIAKKKYTDVSSVSQIQDIFSLIHRSNSELLKRTRNESSKVYKKLKKLKPSKDCTRLEMRLAAIQKGHLRKLNKKLSKRRAKDLQKVISFLRQLTGRKSTARPNKVNKNVSSFPAQNKTKSTRAKIGPAAVQKRLAKQDARRRAARQGAIRNLNRQLNRIRSKKF